MKISVVDDKEDDRQYLISCLKKFSFEQNCELEIEDYSCGEDFLDCEDLSTLNVVFLDIYMGSISGMDVAKILREREYHGSIAFCTTTADYALEGYSVKAISYIVKPFSYEEIALLLQDILKILNRTKPYIRIKDGRQWYKIELCDIQYVENQANYVDLHTINKRYSTRMSFKEMEALLLKHSCFIKCDRGIVVNLLNVKEIKDGTILMKNDNRLPISRRNVTVVNKRYFDFIFDGIGET